MEIESEAMLCLVDTGVEWWSYDGKWRSEGMRSLCMYRFTDGWIRNRNTGFGWLILWEGIHDFSNYSARGFLRFMMNLWAERRELLWLLLGSFQSLQEFSLSLICRLTCHYFEFVCMFNKPQRHYINFLPISQSTLHNLPPPTSLKLRAIIGVHDVWMLMILRIWELQWFVGKTNRYHKSISGDPQREV